MEEVAASIDELLASQLGGSLSVANNCKQYLDEVLSRLQEIIPFEGRVLSEEQFATTRMLFANFIARCLQIYFLQNTMNLQAATGRAGSRADEEDLLRWMPKDAPWNFSRMSTALRTDLVCEAHEFLRSEAEPHEPAMLGKAALERANSLTGKEKEVLRWIAEGKTSREVGMILSISERTVKFHLRNIYSKLNVVNRTQAVTIASRLKLA